MSIPVAILKVTSLSNLHQCRTVRELVNHFENLIHIKLDPLLVWVLVLCQIVDTFIDR